MVKVKPLNSCVTTSKLFHLFDSVQMILCKGCQQAVREAGAPGTCAQFVASDPLFKS